MKGKYEDKSLLFQLYRKDEMERLKKKIQTIKSRRPTICNTKNTSAINLPLISGNNKRKSSRRQDS